MRAALILLPLFLFAGCDQLNQKLGLEDPAKKEAKLEAEGKAVGSACRQSGRAIEDCYAIYSWLPKSPIFEGWREMDAYMRDNKIDTVAPQLPPPEPPGTKKKKKTVTEDVPEPKAEKPAEKSSEDSGEKKPEKAAEKEAEKAADKAAEKTTEKPADKPLEKASAKR